MNLVFWMGKLATIGEGGALNLTKNDTLIMGIP